SAVHNVPAPRNSRGATETTRRSAKILRHKPVRPMNVSFRPLVPRNEGLKAGAFGRRNARLPPLFQNRTLHQTIRPADDGQRAEHALAKGHAPKEFDWREENPAPA